MPIARRRWSKAPLASRLPLVSLLLSVAASIPAMFDISREHAGLGIAAIVLLPICLHWWSRRTLLLDEPILVVGIVWVLAVTLPTMIPDFYRDQTWYTTTTWSLDMAAVWMYRGWAACSVAYWSIRCLGAARPAAMAAPAVLVQEDRLRRLLGVVGCCGTVSYILLTGGQGYAFIDTEATASSVLQIVFELKQFSIAYVFLYFLSRGTGRHMPREKLLLAAILSLQAIIFLTAGTKSIMVENVAAWVLGNAAASGRSGRLMREVAMGMTAILIIYGTFYVVVAYRIEMKRRTIDLNATLVQALSMQADALGVAVNNIFSGAPIGDQQNQYDASSMLDRMAYMAAFGVVLDQSRGIPPYENSYASFLAPVLAVLPRDLLAEKTSFLNSGRFAALLGWSYGGFSVTIPGSLFWAWGFEGIIFGMAGMGALLAWLWGRSTGSGPMTLVVRAVMFREVLALLDVGSEFQAIVISMTRTGLILIGLLFLVRAVYPARSSPMPVNFVRQRRDW